MKPLFVHSVRWAVLRSISVGIASLSFTLMAAVVCVPATRAQIAPLPETPAATQQPTEAEIAAALEKARAAALERMRIRHFPEAVPFAEQALKLTEALQGPDAIETAVAAHNLGFLLRRVDRLAEAQLLMERALAIYERINPAVHEDTRNLVSELGQLYLRAGRGEDVVGIYQRLIDRAGREGYATHIGVAHMRNNLAFLLRGLKRVDESVAQWELAIAIYRTQVSPEDEPYRLAIEGMLDRYQSQGKPDQARAFIAATLATLQSGNQGQGKSAYRLRNRLSKLEHAAGNYAEAKEQAALALAMAETRPPEAEGEAVEPLNDLARAERALGNFAAAEQSYKRAIALLDKMGDLANAGIVSDNLATLYGHTDRFDEAEIHHKRALQLLEKALGREHREVGQAAANFGTMLMEAGRHAEAEPLLRRGLAIAEAQSPPDPVAIATIVDNISGVLSKTGRSDDALAYRQRAVSLFESALPPTHPSLATARNNLGSLLTDLGRYAEAETQLRRSLEIAEGFFGADHLNVAVALANLGHVYAAMGQREKAREFLQRALSGQARRYGADHTKLLETLIALGRLEIADGKPKEAFGIFQRAVAIQLAARDRLGVKAQPSREGNSDSRGAFYGLLDAMWKTGGDKDAAAVAPALEIGQWNAMTSAAMALAALGARAGAGDPALGALTRERQDLAADWQATDKALTKLLSESGDRNVEREQLLRDRLAADETRLATIDTELHTKFSRYDDLARPVPLELEELRGLLQPNEAALQYVVTPKETYLWLVSKTQARWVRLPVGQSELLPLVGALRCGLDREKWEGEGRGRCLRLLGLPERTRLRPNDLLPFQIERAQELFAILLGPVREAIAGKDLLIVASGPLTALPFHVLVTEKPQAEAQGDGPDFARVAWLGRSNAVTMLPSLASLKSLRQFAQASHAAAPFIGIGNPLLTGEDGEDRSAWTRQACEAPALTQRVAEITSSASLVRLVRGGIGGVEALRRQPPLPETADELCSVAKYLGAAQDAVLLGANATEGRIKALSASGKLAQARILHLATHGLIAGETQMYLTARAEPSLMLTPPESPSEQDDGLLTATEVATLKLDADWVILSACNTASGDEMGAEELSGLARAFFYAGARSLLVSHWAVDSDATVNLITGAFAAMTKNRQITQAEALRRSMLALIDRGGRQSHPAYWAPFILVGSGAASMSPASEPAVASAAPVPPVAKPVSPAAKPVVASAMPALPVAKPVVSSAKPVPPAAKPVVASAMPALPVAEPVPPVTPPAVANAEPVPPAVPPVVANATPMLPATTPVVASVNVTAVGEDAIPPIPARAPGLVKKASVTPQPATAKTTTARTAQQPIRRKRLQRAPAETGPYETGSDTFGGSR